MQKIFNYYKNKRVGVLGASEFLGSYLLNELNNH